MNKYSHGMPYLGVNLDGSTQLFTVSPQENALDKMVKLGFVNYLILSPNEVEKYRKENNKMEYESRYKQTLHSIETRLYELDKYSAYRRPLSAYDAGRYLELAAMYYSLTGTIWEIAK